MCELRLNDYGTQINITVKDCDGNIVDISSATSIKLFLSPPDNSPASEVYAEFFTDGTDGQIYYIIQDGDLYTIGTWEIQVYIYFNGSLFHTSIEKIKVLRNIGD